MADLYGEIFRRNIGFLTESEQERLRNATVGITGVGGVGGLLAERMIRLGVGHLKITDPGDFELSNMNRQLFSSMASVGRNKAEVVSAHLKEINPEAGIEFDRQGIRTQEDADAFVAGCDVLADLMDFGLFREAIYLQRAARREGIYYLFAGTIGFGGLVVVFDPKGMTLEEYNLLEIDAELDTVSQPEIPLDRVCPVMPSYASAVPKKLADEILLGERPLPTNSVGVGMASLLVANEAVNILLCKRSIPVAPEYTYADLMDRRFVVGNGGGSVGSL